MLFTAMQQLWISNKYTYVPSLLNLPPTFHPNPPKLSQNTGLNFHLTYFLP